MACYLLLLLANGQVDLATLVNPQLAAEQAARVGKIKFNRDESEMEMMKMQQRAGFKLYAPTVSQLDYWSLITGA